jgi:endonuclease YncB( thermonuclease family)
MTPPFAAPTTERRPSRALAPRLLAFALALPPTALLAAEPPPRAPSAPIWTTTPTRIDRSQETRQRIAPAPAADPLPRFVVRGARLADAGALLIDGRRHRLHGIVALPPEHLCTDPDGRRWACGLRARGALAVLASGHALLCHRFEETRGEDPVVDCLWQERSLSERLVADGWADLDADGRATPALAAALDEARRGRRGIWAAAAPSGSPD